MKTADLEPLVLALRTARTGKGLTQAAMAEHLGISRKTYLLMETYRWIPKEKELTHFLNRLREVLPSAAEELARLYPDEILPPVQKPVPPPVAPGLEAGLAKLVFDSAVLAVAEEIDASPRFLRPLVASLLTRLESEGMPMKQAAALARAAAVVPAEKGALGAAQTKP